MAYITKQLATIIMLSLAFSSAAQAAGVSHISGRQVRAAQAQLEDLGYAVGPKDGVVGVMTARALMDFQSRSGLVMTGSLNAETLAMLEQTYSRARLEYGNWEQYVAPRRYNNYGASYPVTTASLAVYWGR